MTGIASTTANLALWRMQWETLFSLPHLLDQDETDIEQGCRLSEIEHFGDNPGNLRLFSYVPKDLPAGSPLVVVLHGCTQTAAAYDRSSGWSHLADRAGFALLFAQQRNENNPRRCFNWFRTQDIARDAGEAASIRQMVSFITDAHHIDRQRVFITGLSAGGGMTNVMLATYPEVFAAGAILAGLPYRAATTVHDALQVMLEGSSRTAEDWGDEVRHASPIGDLAESRIAVEWPRVAVWQGLADDVVRASNATEIVKQWSNVHGVDQSASEEDDIHGNRRLRWRGADGQVLIEAVAIEHLGHAVPIDAQRSDIQEQPGPHFADIGLSSTEEIARFFGLLVDRRLEPVPDAPKSGPAALPVARERRGGGVRFLRRHDFPVSGRRQENERQESESQENKSQENKGQESERSKGAEREKAVVTDQSAPPDQSRAAVAVAAEVLQPSPVTIGAVRVPSPPSVPAAPAPAAPVPAEPASAAHAAPVPVETGRPEEDTPPKAGEAVGLLGKVEGGAESPAPVKRGARSILSRVARLFGLSGDK